MDIIKQYNSIGKKYIAEKDKFFSNNEDCATDFIKKSLPDLKNKTLLDLGCGGGDDIQIYESLGAKNIYGIDSSEIMVKEAKKMYLNLKLYHAQVLRTQNFPTTFLTW